VTGRFPLAPPLREAGFFIPADLTARQRAAAFDLVSDALRAHDVDSGCVHTEIKFTPDGPRIIEVNGRLGGGIPLLLDMTTGASAPRLAMEVALGAPSDVGALARQEDIVFRLLFHAPPTAHKVLSIEGLERINQLPGTPIATLHRPPGTEIDWRTGTNDYIYSVIGMAKDYDELRVIHQTAEAGVHVQFEDLAPQSQATEHRG
jgi:biotin carboxylase